jgi:BirA family transcriptional regulator, biotin operon repressor / biotin---[acetyl-CoA-carboxylase] ligase
MDPPFSHHRLAASLAGQRLGHTIVFLPETGSTNDEARRLAEQGHPEGVVVITDHQTHGRGRRGAEWFSPPRKSLLLSVILRPGLPPEQWPRLTHVAALAGCEAIESMLPESRPQVKWPNDLQLGGRKCAGLLLECAFPTGRTPFAVLGFGLNINLALRDLPVALRAETTSLTLANNGIPLSREPIAAAFLRALDRLYGQMATDFTAILAALRHRSCLVGLEVRATVGGVEVTGRAIDLSPEGGLVLEFIDGTQRILSTVDFIRPLEGRAGAKRQRPTS